MKCRGDHNSAIQITKKRDIMKERRGYTKRWCLFHSFLGAPFRRQPCKYDKQVVSRVYGTLATEEGKDVNRGEVRKKQRDAPSPSSRALRRG